MASATTCCGKLFPMLMLLAPALLHGQTVTAAWDPSPAGEQVIGYDVCVGTSLMDLQRWSRIRRGRRDVPYLQPNRRCLHYVAIRARNSAGPGPFSPEFRFSIPSLEQPGNHASVAGIAITPVNLSVIDPDGSPITITHTGLPMGLSINSSTRQITGTPAAAGAYDVTLFANDGIVTVSRSFTWMVTSTKPLDDFDGDGRSDLWRYGCPAHLACGGFVRRVMGRIRAINGE